MQKARLDELQAVIKIARRNSNNLSYADNTTLMAESEEELKNLLMRVKEQSEKASLKLHIKKAKIIASCPITSWQTEGEKVEAVTDFLFLGSEITVDGDCRHEIRRWLFLGQESYDKLDSVLKSKDITLLTKVLIVKAMIFPVVMSRCESWTVKKAEHWTIDAFKQRYWRRLLESLESKEIKAANLQGNQPWVLFGRTDAEALTHWPPDVNCWLIGKDPDAGEDWRQKEKRVTEDEIAGWHHRWNGHELEQTPGDGEGQRGLVCCSPWGHKESDMTWRLNNNTCLIFPTCLIPLGVYCPLVLYSFLSTDLL